MLCAISKDANITMNDVSKQDALIILAGYLTLATVFFVPRLTFQKPEEGEWLKSRSVKVFYMVTACLNYSTLQVFSFKITY